MYIFGGNIIFHIILKTKSPSKARLSVRENTLGSLTAVAMQTPAHASPRSHIMSEVVRLVHL
jgi:hypothetical protein